MLDIQEKKSYKKNYEHCSVVDCALIGGLHGGMRDVKTLQVPSSTRYLISRVRFAKYNSSTFTLQGSRRTDDGACALRCRAHHTNGQPFPLGEDHAVLGEDRAIQREILRNVYESTDLHDIEKILYSSDEDIISHIDGETALDILAYLAEHVEHSRIAIHDVQTCDNIVKLLFDSCIKIERCSSAGFGMLLWALELLPQQGACWRRSLLVEIAIRECRIGEISHYSTRDLTNIIVTCGRLCGYHFDNNIDRRVMRYLELLLLELASRIEKPHVRSAFGGSAFADLAYSVSLLYDGCHAQGNEQGCIACGAFLSNLSSEVKRKLANRHSSSSRAFNAEDLKKFLFSYVKIRLLSPDIEAPTMLDQVASYISGQMKEHSEAYTIQDLAAILEFFAFYKISSLAVLDLFSHSGVQVRLMCSTVLDARRKGEMHPQESDDGTWLAALVSIMTSHIQLRIRPTDTTLISILPVVRLYSQFSETEDKTRLIRVFETFDFHCGDKLQDEILNTPIDCVPP